MAFMARTTPEEPLLREAAAGDEEQLVEVIHAAFEELRGRLDPPSGSHDESIETVRRQLQSGGAVMAFVGGRPAGCVFYLPRKDHVYLSRLGVLPEHRRRGLGLLLIGRVEERALSLCIPRVRLGVRNTLPRQREYYQRLGYRFHSDGFHEGHRQPTFAFLEKDLEHPSCAS
jgi:GNAT superfamily N-acetyltransferase